MVLWLSGLIVGQLFDLHHLAFKQFVAQCLPAFDIDEFVEYKLVLFFLTPVFVGDLNTGTCMGGSKIQLGGNALRYEVKLLRQGIGLDLKSFDHGPAFFAFVVDSPDDHVFFVLRQHLDGIDIKLTRKVKF